MDLPPGVGPAASCAGKVIYLTRQAAQRALAGLHRREEHALHVYPCHWGPHWHIGNNNRMGVEPYRRERRWEYEREEYDDDRGEG